MEAKIRSQEAKKKKLHLHHVFLEYVGWKYSYLFSKCSMFILLSPRPDTIAVSAVAVPKGLRLMSLHESTDILVVCNLTLYSLAYLYQSFAGNFCLCPRNSGLLWPLIWRQQNPENLANGLPYLCDVMSHVAVVFIFVTGLMVAYLITDSLLLRLCDTVTLFSLTTVAGYFSSAHFTYKCHHNFIVQRTECYM